MNVSAGFTDHQLGMLSDASAHYSHAFAVRRTHLGEDHPDTSEALSLLQAVRKSLGLPATLTSDELDKLWVPVSPEKMLGNFEPQSAEAVHSTLSPSSTNTRAKSQPASTQVHVSRNGSISIESIPQKNNASPPKLLPSPSGRKESNWTEKIPRRENRCPVSTYEAG